MRNKRPTHLCTECCLDLLQQEGCVIPAQFRLLQLACLRHQVLHLPDEVPCGARKRLAALPAPPIPLLFWDLAFSTAVGKT